MIHLRVVSPPDITDALVPVLRRKPADMNLTVLRSTGSNPDEDVVQFDVPQGVADEVAAGGDQFSAATVIRFSCGDRRRPPRQVVAGRSGTGPLL